MSSWVVVSNPVKTRIIAAAKIKMDKVDAEILAQLLRCNYLPKVWAPRVITARLDQLHQGILEGSDTGVEHSLCDMHTARCFR
jgi:hypothetical protein